MWIIASKEPVVWKGTQRDVVVNSGYPKQPPLGWVIIGIDTDSAF